MTLKTQVAHGLKWQAISIVGSQMLSLVVFTTLARLLEPSAFGLISLVGVYLGFVSMFTDQGISTALIQRQDLEAKHKDAAFWFNLGCAFILCLGTMALAGPLSNIFKEPQLVPLLRWSSVGLVIQASSAIHNTLFSKAMNFRQPVIRGLIANAAGGAVGVGMALAGCGVWSLIGQQLAGAVAGAMFLWRMSSYRPALRFSWPHLRQLFSFSSSVFGVSILWYFSSRLDQITIGRFAGVSMLGLYTVAGKIPNLANTMTKSPLANVSLPSLSRLQDNHGKMLQTVYRGMELNAVVSFAVYIGLAVIAPDVVPLLFGTKWAPAATLCSWLSIYALTDTLLVFCYPVLLATGGIGKYVWLNIWHILGVLAACLAGIRFGVTSLVVGLIVNNLAIAFPALLFLRQRIGLSPFSYCKPCLVPALASLVMVGGVWLMAALLPTDVVLLVRLACKVLVGAISYLGCVVLFAPSVLRTLAGMVVHSFRRPDVLADASTTM